MRGGDGFGRSNSMLAVYDGFGDPADALQLLSHCTQDGHRNGRALAAGGAESCSRSRGPIRRHATGRRVEACRLLCANAACAAACVCCQTRGGAGPFGDRTRQSYSPGGRCGLEHTSNTQVEVAAPLGAVLQHRTPVARDGASTLAGILAVPDAGPAAFAVSLQLRAQRGHRHRRLPNGARCRSCGRSGGCVGIAS